MPNEPLTQQNPNNSAKIGTSINLLTIWSIGAGLSTLLVCLWFEYGKVKDFFLKKDTWDICFTVKLSLTDSRSRPSVTGTFKAKSDIGSFMKHRA